MEGGSQARRCARRRVEKLVAAPSRIFRDSSFTRWQACRNTGRRGHQLHGGMGSERPASVSPAGLLFLDRRKEKGSAARDCEALTDTA